MDHTTDNSNNTKNDGDHDDGDHDDPEDKLQSQMWTYSVWIASIPLLYYGYYKAACCFVGIGILYLFQSNFIQQSIPMIDQYKIKYDIYSPEDILKDITALHYKYLMNQEDPAALLSDTKTDAPSRNNENDKKSIVIHREIILVAFTILAKKYNQLLEQQKKSMTKHSKPSKSSAKIDHTDKLQHLAKQYQDVVHAIVFDVQLKNHQSSSLTTAAVKWLGNDDEIIAAALALLALISKQWIVRQRYCNRTASELLSKTRINDTTTTTTSLTFYDFGTILQCIDNALLRAKEYNNETKDHCAAELQRKACLFIGAISDDIVTDENNHHHKKQEPLSLAIQIGQRGGIQTILNALSWYQYHSKVVNWGCWSIFILCYEHCINQTIMIQLNGIPILIQSMKNCLNDNDIDSCDVARHGTAILFDMLREHNNSDNAKSTDQIDRWKVRNIAISSGLHECIVQAMRVSINSTNMDIFVMGREILIGTNYQGSIPEPPMTLIPSG